ncbi:MAG: hypothetical protein ACKO2G_10775 [Verrucomicrobiales bacterium]
MLFSFFIRRLAMWSALLVVGLGLWLGIHVSSAGLAEHWKEAVRKEFARQGIDISIGKLTIDPLHGLVARDVRVYEPQDPSRPPDGGPGSDGVTARREPTILADISRIDLDVSLTRLMQKEIYLNSLKVRDAKVSLPVDPEIPDGERLEVSECNARVLFSADSVEIQELNGRLLGVRVNLNGELVRHPKKLADGKPKTWQGVRHDQRLAVRQALRGLAPLRVPKGAPAELRVRAMADLGRLEEGRFEFTFLAPQLAWEEMEAREIRLSGHWDNGLLQMEDIRFRDEGGAFRAEADFIRSTGVLRFNVESTAMLPELARQRLWPNDWPLFRLVDPPRVTAGGSLAFSKELARPIGVLTGSFALGRSQVGDDHFEFASANIASDGKRVFLRDLRVRQKEGGDLRADILLDGDELRARGQSTVHPETVAPLVPRGFVRDLLAAFDCGNGTSAMGFTVLGNFKVRESWAVETNIEARDIRFHGVPITSATGKWAIRETKQVFENALVKIPAGATTGIGTDARTTSETVASAQSITLHPPFGQTEFNGVRCQGWPHTVIAAVVPQTLRAVPKFKLSDPGDLAVDGVLGGRTGPKSDLRMTMASRGMLLYPAFGKELPLQSPSAMLTLKDRSAILPVVEASCYGGRVSGNLRFDNLGSEKISSSGKIMLKDIGYQQLMRLFSDRPDDAKGTLDVIATFTCADATLNTLDAEGSMKLVNGDLFSIPLFGPLSPLIEAVLPERGIGYSVASTATATATVRQGVLTTEDFTAMTPAFKMDGRGTIHLPTNGVEFFARFNARGIAEVATVIFSYIFEYKCEGTLGKPEWKPLRIPKLPIPKIPLPKLPLPGRDGN